MRNERRKSGIVLEDNHISILVKQNQSYNIELDYIIFSWDENIVIPVKSKMCIILGASNIFKEVLKTIASLTNPFLNYFKACPNSIVMNLL